MNALRQFEAAARLLSFRKAAEELHLTASAVSHAVGNLEQWLGADLFVRDPKGLRLTTAGESLLPGVRNGLSAIESSASAVRARQHAERIAVSATPTFANAWLMPRLCQFQRQYPGISVVIDTSHVPRDLLADSVDVAIRMGTGEWSGLDCHLLFTERLVPVCSPTLAELYEDSGSLADLHLLHVDTVTDDWAYWCDKTGAELAASQHVFHFDSVHTAWNAAVHGLGVAIGRLPLVSPLLKDRSLVAIAGEPVRSGVGHWYLLTRPGSANRPAVQCFREWVTAEIGPPD